MGDAQRRRRRLIDEHPWCCFCGGSTPASSVDHVPPRTCFKGRAGPEGFEFPACSHCQTASRLDEMAVAFYVQALDSNPDNFDEAAVNKAITGIANNLPHLLPNPYLSGARKRAFYRELGLAKPTNRLARELPVIQIHPDLHDRINRYARKLACALFYREQKRIASPDHHVMAHWGQAADPRFREMAQAWMDMTPMIDVGKRTNLDFGDRFAYRYNRCSDPDVFASFVGFGLGIHLLVLVADEETTAKIQEGATPEQQTFSPPWVKVKDNYLQRAQ